MTPETLNWMERARTWRARCLLAEKRLEAAEKRRLVVERRLVYLEWDGDWDGLEGYVQVMLNQDAAVAQPNDETCSCGHLWTSHNEHGCCWDDDCGCDKPRLAALAGEEKPSAEQLVGKQWLAMRSVDPDEHEPIEPDDDRILEDEEE
jgi:hypothetical protein